MADFTRCRNFADFFAAHFCDSGIKTEKLGLYQNMYVLLHRDVLVFGCLVSTSMSLGPSPQVLQLSMAAATTTLAHTRRRRSRRSRRRRRRRPFQTTRRRQLRRRICGISKQAQLCKFIAFSPLPPVILPSLSRWQTPPQTPSTPLPP